ncbi:SAM-dependent methyltransferase [Haloactinopolyspora sp.]|uniref:SAM-dependent methyltransferase n=1 Tax=Haloactinopolyspora sp. TaxID=1966353 RepID=UPI002601A5C2|nr:SAM-dependent methyltransferase [Haloactinopolyspora sp.]
MSSAESAEDGPAPMHIDTTKPSTARVYDAALGGKDNYAVDREMLAQLNAAAPEVMQAANENRAFLVRVCRYLANQVGIEQFLDCGSGLPTAENVHQVVQRINPDARVVYIDNDPIVLAHGRALLEENDRTHFAAADIFDPSAVLDNEVVQAHIDFTQPVAFLQLASLHFCADDPAGVMRQYVDALPSGSYVAFSHAFDPENEYHEMAMEAAEVMSSGSAGRTNFRTRAELEPILDGLDVLEPGLVYVADWWPSGPRFGPLLPVQHLIVGALARKP